MDNILNKGGKSSFGENLRKSLKITKFGIKNSYTLIVGMFLLCIVVMPMMAVFGWGTARFSSQDAEWIFKGFGAAAAYFAGIFAPYTLFSYVHNRTQRDFYSAMPITRSQYFAGYITAGFLIFLVPYILMTIAAAIVTQSSPMPYFHQPLTIFISLFSSLTFSIMLSNSGSSTFITFMLRNGIPASVVLLPFVLARLDTQPYFDLLADKVITFTPLGSGCVIRTEFNHICPFLVLIALAELVLAYFMNLKRKNETSLALAFPKTRYLYQYAVLTVFSLLVDGFMAMLLGIRYDSGISSEDISVVIFFTVVCAFVAFMILNVVLEKNSKAAFHRIRHLFFFLGGYGVIVSTTIIIIVNSLPFSVIPFSPKFAVVSVYSLEQIDAKDETISFDDRVIFRIYGERDSDEYYARKLSKEFIVTNPQHLRDFTDMVAKSSYSNSLDINEDIFLLPYREYANYYTFQDEVPKNTVIIKVDFCNINPDLLGSENSVTVNKLKNIQSLYPGKYRIHTRYGLALISGSIDKYGDMDVLQ